MARTTARQQVRMGRRLRLLLSARRTLDVILAHVRNGGSLIELCDTWQVRYSDVIAWVRADAKRKELYEEAGRDRSEWTDEMVLSEIRLMCRFDIRKLYDEQGALLPIHKLDAATARMVMTAEVDEIKRGNGDVRVKVGETTKVKVYDKLKALELAAKSRRLLVDKTEHDVSERLEDILAKSYDDPAAPGATAHP